MSATTVSGLRLGWLDRLFSRRRVDGDIPRDPAALHELVRRRDAEDLARGVKPSSSMIWRSHTGANMFPWMGE